MKYEFHPEAEWEFIEEAARYELEVPGLGHRFGSEIERVVELLLENPKIGAPDRTGKGRQVSFVVKKRKQSTTPYTDWMKARIDSDAGKAIYSQRMSVVEPVFGNLTSNKRLRRFSLRGRTKVNGQWQLFCLVHNIEKLQNFGSLGR